MYMYMKGQGCCLSHCKSWTDSTVSLNLGVQDIIMHTCTCTFEICFIGESI